MNLLSKTKKTYIILLLVIAVQLFRIIYSFSFLKEDYHSDEAWSFGLSNSYYEPFIFENADSTQYVNIDEWFSTEKFKNYLTVSPGQRFSYGSVYYNQTKDNHPPLYYMILHTICSFFPDKFSFWYGFVINIVSFVVLQFFLFKLSEEITDSEFMAICTCCFFGFSTGALNIFVFVRMYSLLAMITVISAYLHTKLLKTGDFQKYLVFIFIVTLAGALTHHFFLIFAGALSACFCIFYLVKKEVKRLLIYASVLLMSAVTSVLIFPATIKHIHGPKMNVKKYSTEWQFKYSINSVLNELFGLNIGLFRKPDAAIAIVFIIAVLLMLLPLGFLFRNEEWFKKFIGNIKIRLIRYGSSLKANFKRNHCMMLFLLISSLSVVSGTALIVSASQMLNTIDRYNFMVFPLISVAFSALLSYVVETFVRRKRVCLSTIALIISFFTVSSNIKYPCTYLFHKECSIPLSEVLENSNIIYISNEHWLITAFSSQCLKSEMFYSTSPEHLINEEAKLSLPDNDKPVYLIINEQCLNDKENLGKKVFYNEIPNFIDEANLLTTDELKDILDSSFEKYEYTYIGKDSIFCRSIMVYQLRQ